MNQPEELFKRNFSQFWKSCCHLDGTSSVKVKVQWELQTFSLEFVDWIPTFFKGILGSKKVTPWIAICFFAASSNPAISILNLWRSLRLPLFFQYFGMAPVQAISLLLNMTTGCFLMCLPVFLWHYGIKFFFNDMIYVCVLTLWSEVFCGNLPHHYCFVIGLFFWQFFRRILQLFVSWFVGGTRFFFFF